LFLLVFWVFAVLVTSPQDVNAWRFSFMAILPLTLMAGLGIAFLFTRPAVMTTARKRAKRTSGNPGRSRSVLTAIVCVGLLVLGSWGTTMLSDSFTLTQANAQAQNDVYQAMQWL